MFYVYIIHSRSLQRYYAGSTEIVEKRSKEHNAGKSKSTQTGVPWELIHTECFTTRAKAIQRERKIKARGIERYLSDLQKTSSGHAPTLVSGHSQCVSEAKRE
jgi:putative endonuclease